MKPRLSLLELNADKAHEEFRRSNGHMPLCPTCRLDGNYFGLGPKLVVSGAGLGASEFAYMEWVCDNGHSISAAVLLGLLK